MNSRQVIQRLRAYQEGKPRPCGSTKHTYLADDDEILVVAFVRMGGESRPWGIAYGSPGSPPKIDTVPDGRDPDLVAKLAARFALVLLDHIRTPDYGDCAPELPEDWQGEPDRRPQDLGSLHQVWLPNATHLDMFHHLAYAYAFTKWGAERRALLNQFGRACGWLFREAQRPGQQHVMVATSVLRAVYTFPAEDIRQGHLGYLLAWFQPRGPRAARQRSAARAELRPIATSLDPALERGELRPLVEAYGEAKARGSSRSMTAAHKRIEDVLAPELEHRFHLTVEAIRRYRADRRPMNPGVSKLVEAGCVEHWYQHLLRELRDASEYDGAAGSESHGPVYAPSVETDRHPAAAASRYHVHQASAELVESLLIHDDPELQAEWIAEGEALRGVIVAVHDEREGRTTKPVWVIEDSYAGQLKLRPGNKVCVVGCARRKGEVRSVVDSEGGRHVEVEITGLKTAGHASGPHDRAASDQAWKDEEITLVKDSGDKLSRDKSRRVWRKNGPGAWLTLPPPKDSATADPDDEDDAARVEAARSNLS